jgi:hypothetical protein
MRALAREEYTLGQIVQKRQSTGKSVDTLNNAYERGYYARIAERFAFILNQIGRVQNPDRPHDYDECFDGAVEEAENKAFD